MVKVVRVVMNIVDCLDQMKTRSWRWPLGWHGDGPVWLLFWHNFNICFRKAVSSVIKKWYSLSKKSMSAFQICMYQASLIAQLVKNLPAMQETPVWFWVGKIPWRRLPTPVFLGFPCGSADLYATSFCTDISSSCKTLQVGTRHFNNALLPSSK